MGRVDAHHLPLRFLLVVRRLGPLRCLARALHDARLALGFFAQTLSALASFCDLAPYRLRASDLHEVRRFLGIFAQAFSALASFCARVSGLGFFVAGCEGGERLPGPENVELPSGSEIEACGKGAVLHMSAVAQGDGEAAGGERHGDVCVHSWASYTSRLLSMSCGTS